MTLGERLRQLRNEQRLTSVQMAVIIGKSRPAISGYESGNEPSFTVLVRYADYFGMTVQQLIEPVDFSTLLSNEYIPLPWMDGDA